MLAKINPADRASLLRCLLFAYCGFADTFALDRLDREATRGRIGLAPFLCGLPDEAAAAS